MQNATMNVNREGAVPTGLIDNPASPAADRLDELVALHEPRIRRLVHRLLGWKPDTADVDDIVQDVFLAALKKGSSFRGEANIATWLMAVAINRCRTHRRRQIVRLSWLRRQRWPGNAPPASEPAEADETSQHVRSAVQSLRPADREAIVLFYLESFSTSEIAKLLNLSVNAVDVRLHRARQRLKEKLKHLIDSD